MKPSVIFEDESLLIVEKPSGWITNEASTTKNQPVLQTWLAENLNYQISNDKEYRSGIVHRLDKETSGVLVVAKTRNSFEALQGQFKDRLVEKTYVALVHGLVEPTEGEVNAPVGRLPWRRDRFGVLPGGREARTSYETLKVFSLEKEKYTLLELGPKSGRTHQIRIHLKHIGNPIVADEFYAGRKTARSDRKWCPRLFLHASGITFAHPEKDKKVSFNSALPKDLELALKTLESLSENNYS